MKTFRAIIQSIGPIGSVAIGVVVLVCLRNVVRSFSFDIGPRTEDCTTSIITSLRDATILKPYKVIVSGFAKEDEIVGSNVVATLEYQYKGMTEYSLDLSKMEVKVENEPIRKIHIVSKKPTMEKPIALQLNGPRLWKVNEKRGGGNWSENFRRRFGKIEHNAIVKAAQQDKFIEKAVMQSENTLRFMLSPAVADPNRDIIFEWK